ncbi:MFS transporter [Pochonia chlamydosporia 170]|uniref:MFS transporter n=1 Tax=Pochonia chlamydosporia 170 TaxID=1380566 RepID=A0A179FKK4_METCM|nr:MFS transporter [Pochonia chlamydosporia 170]OAQ65878.1 MFS transporter [Pochonia chlamydosporia 170]
MTSLSKTDTALEPSVETESTTEHTTKGQSTTIQASLTRGIDPELIAAVERISPERRVEIEKRLKRKIDCFLFPLLLIFYILNYIDRNALGFAKLVGIEKDLGLTDTEFATCLSILYVGYCLFQVPSNLMLSKSKPALYLPFWMGIWGVVSGCAAAVHNYHGLVTVRFVLGIVEAPFFPGAVFLLSSWYTRKEMAMRCAILFGGNMLSNAFGSLIALGVTQDLDGVHGLESWRWLFLIEACMTVGFALISVFLLPNYPHNTRWLKGEERTIAIWRLIEDVGTADDSESSKYSMWDGFVMAVKDYKTWVLVANHLLLTTGAGIVVFYPTVVGTLKFSREITYALIAPPYLVGFATSVYGCHHADMKKERTWHMVGPLIVTLIGLIILASTLNTGARYFSLFLVTCFVYIAFDCNLAWIQNCIPRPAPKRAAAIALVNMLSQLGNIIVSYCYPSNQSPRFWLASVVEGVAVLLAICLTLTFREILKRENKKLDEKDRREGVDPTAGSTFRYIY